MIRKITNDLFSAFFFSGLLILIYYLRANGFKSSVIFLFVFFFLLLTYLLRLKISISSLIFVPLLVGLISLPYASRGPAFTDSLFIFSFSAPLSVLFFSFKKKKLFPGEILLSLLVPVSIWSFTANWEFPSTFSPFVIYGIRECPWVFATVLMALPLSNYEIRRLNSLIAPVLINILSLLLLFRFDSPALSDLFPIEIKQSLFILVALGFIAFLFSSRLQYYDINIQTDEDERLFAARFMLLVPIVITLIFLTSYNLRISLPMPFSPGKIAAASVFALSSYGLVLLNWKQRKVSFFLALIFFLLFLIRLSLPVEFNQINHFGNTYTFYSFGFEHLGIWATFLILFVFLFLKPEQKFYSITLLFGFIISLTVIYYSRLYHFITWLPVEVFKDLGAEGVSWIRKSIYPGENIILPFLVGIIIILGELARNEKRI